MKEPSSADGPDAPETLCGRYQLGKPLGHGGMGEVRAGWDPRLGRDVAIKLLRPDVAAQPTVRERFEAEARAAALLVHPHVVAVFDSGEEAGIPFLVMEQLPGRTLHDAIAEGPLDPADVREVGLQVLDALAAAHAAGLMHRDIKPANVLEAGPGNWKVGDFGIAKSVEVADPHLTTTGLIVGTPAYLAPERLLGGPATPQSDLYAVAVVLYEALCGARPDEEAAPSSVYRQERPPLDEVRPGLPPDLVAAITKAMDPDPTVRFRSANDMAAQLREHRAPAAAAPTEAFMAPPVNPTQIMRQPTSTQALPKAVGWALRRRRALLGGLAGAGLFIIVVVLLANAFGGQGASSPTTAASPSAPPPTTTSSSAGLPPGLSGALQELEKAVQP